MSEPYVVSLDLQALSQAEHADVARSVRELVPDCRIVESDQRHVREIDRAQLQTYCVVISATCAAISASVLVTNKIESMQSRPAASGAGSAVESAITEVEKRCGVKLSSETKNQIARCAYSDQLDHVVEVDVVERRYEIKISKGSRLHLRGTLKAKEGAKARQKKR